MTTQIRKSSTIGYLVEIDGRNAGRVRRTDAGTWAAILFPGWSAAAASAASQGATTYARRADGFRTRREAVREIEIWAAGRYA